MDPDELWSAIYDLFFLLQEKVNDEIRYQKYFEKHPVVFRVLDIGWAKPFDKRSGNKLPYNQEYGYSPEPDFLCGQSTNGTLTVFELKTPFVDTSTTSSTSGQREKFRASLESYISQTLEYVECIRGSEDARKVVCDAFEMPRISSYETVIVYGMKNTESAASIKRLADKRKDRLLILSFDEILDKLINAYAIGRSDIHESTGLCLMLQVRILEQQKHAKAYVLDMGNASRNRMSMYVKDGMFVFECRDESGKVYQIVSNPIFDEIIGIRFTYSEVDGLTLISGRVSDKEVGFQKGNVPLNIKIDFSNCSFGSDLAGKHKACFDAFINAFVNKSPGLVDQLFVHREINQKRPSGTHYAEFRGQSRMVKVERGLQAPSNRERPVLRAIE